SENPLRVLCIGHGGGSLPLFLATAIEGAYIDIVEIDPLVISASVKAMGFPPFSVTSPSGTRIMSGNTILDAAWSGIHERLYLHESDAEQFVFDNKKIYDIVFIDAYDGNDIFPHKLWNHDSPFLQALTWRLHPGHGTVVVNLHSDVDIRDSDGSVSSFVQSTLPMGKYISKVCSAYRDAVLGHRSCTRKSSPGLGFVVSVPSLYNTTLVVSRGFPLNRGSLDRDFVLNTLISKSIEMEDYLDLPFSCLKFIKSGFVVLD
ncbi:Polyamine aminopropyltransferase-like protein, partial [Drosera capensis]